MPENISQTLLAVAGTLLGVALGILGTYFVSIHLALSHAKALAALNLSNSFAPQIAYLKSFEGFTESTEKIRERLYSAFVSTHAAELEKFRFYVKSKNIQAYDKACEEYEELLHTGLLINVGNQEPSKFFVGHIRALLDFTR